MVAWLLPLLALSAAPHPDSMSRTEIRVGEREIRLEVRFQARTLQETLPVDQDGDDHLSPGELERARGPLEAYLVQVLHLRADVAESSGAVEPLPLSLESIEDLDAAAAAAGGFRWLVARCVLPLEHPIGSLEVESFLFLDSNPDHRDFVGVAWEDEPMAEVLLGGGKQTELFRSAGERRPAVLFAFGRLGVRHILGGYDHLAFLLALLVAARGPRSLVGVVTAFTAAHSITLGLAALGLVRLPSHFVELAIALSIAYVGVDNLLRREPRTPWLEAFGFGLLHGLGFAGFLADSLAGEPLLVTALVGFNSGVELGQLAVVLGMVVLLRLVPRARAAEAPAPPPAAAGPAAVAVAAEGWTPAWFRLAASAGVAAVGFFWFLQRAGWLPSLG